MLYVHTCTQSGEAVALMESTGYSRLQEDHMNGGGGERARDVFDTNTHMEGDTTYNTEEGGMPRIASFIPTVSGNC